MRIGARSARSTVTAAPRHSVPTTAHDAHTSHNPRWAPWRRQLADHAAVHTREHRSDGLPEHTTTLMVRKGSRVRLEGAAAPAHHARASVLAGCTRLGPVVAARRRHMCALALDRQQNQAQQWAICAHLGTEVEDRRLARHVDVCRAARTAS